MKPEKDKFELKYGEAGKCISLLMKLGVVMVSSILVFFGVGYVIEKKFPFKGLWLIGFTILGVFGGFFLMFKEINKTLDQDSNENLKNPEDSNSKSD